jgi:hypothetical protein
MYLIYSRKHSHGEVIWWGANRSGYTRDWATAGRYTLEEAREICSHPEDSIPVDEVFATRALHMQFVIDEGNNREELVEVMKCGLRLLERGPDEN